MSTMPEYLKLSTEKKSTYRQLEGLSGRIAQLLDSPALQSRRSLLACLDDLLGAVYSLFYAIHHDYTDREKSLSNKDIKAVAVRAADMASGRVRCEGQWTAGFYFNNTLFRIAAVYHRTLKVVTGKENTKLFPHGLLSDARKVFKQWQGQDWTNTNLQKVYDQVNDLKHTANGIIEGRDVGYNDALEALRELLILIESAGAHNGD